MHHAKRRARTLSHPKQQVSQQRNHNEQGLLSSPRCHLRQTSHAIKSLLIVIPLLAYLLLWVAKSAPLDALHGASKESVFTLWWKAFVENWAVFKIYLPFVGLCWLLFQFGQAKAARTLVVFAATVVALLLTAISCGRQGGDVVCGAVGLFSSIGWSNTFSLALEGRCSQEPGFVAAGDGDSRLAHCFPHCKVRWRT